MSILPVSGQAFPRPDFEAVRRYRQAMSRSIGSSGEGVLRAQQLAILDALERTDAKVLEVVDAVRTNFQALDLTVYTVAIRQLDHDTRTPEQNLAFVRYQQEAADEMYRLVESVRKSLGLLDAALTALQTAVLANTTEQVKCIRSLLDDPLLSDSQRYSLGFLLEDMQGAANMASARCGYLDEVQRMLVPVRFFCQSVFDSGDDVIEVVKVFQQRIDELGSYLSELRKQWPG